MTVSTSDIINGMQDIDYILTTGNSLIQDWKSVKIPIALFLFIKDKTGILLF